MKTVGLLDYKVNQYYDQDHQPNIIIFD